MFQSYDVGHTGKMMGVHSLVVFLWAYFRVLTLGMFQSYDAGPHG